VPYIKVQQKEGFMGRNKGSLSKANYKTPPTCEMTIEDRMRIIANISVDRIKAKLKQAKDEKAKETDNV